MTKMIGKEEIRPQTCACLCVSVADGLYKSKDQIYPGQDFTLTCNTTLNNTIKWTRNGIELQTSDRYIIEKNVLTVKNSSPADSGKLQPNITVCGNIANVANTVSHYEITVLVIQTSVLVLQSFSTYLSPDKTAKEYSYKITLG